MKIYNENLEGNRFGRLTVIKNIGIINGRTTYECLCDCGNTKNVIKNSLIRGNTKSCGCIHKENVSNRMSTHKMSKGRFYNIYCHIIARCCNEKTKYYNHYGGRGIIMCDEWRNSFDNFYNDMYNEYETLSKDIGEENVSIERIDVNGNYELSNCKWIHRSEQSQNMRRTIYIEFNEETKSLSKWCKFFDIPYDRAYNRYKRGKDLDIVFKK